MTALVRTDSWVPVMVEKPDGTCEVTQERSVLGMERHVSRWTLAHMPAPVRNEVVKNLTDIEYNYLIRDGAKNPLRDVLEE